MKIFLILLLSMLATSRAYSQITFQWLGVSGFALSDETTTLIFDPAMTRLGFRDYLPFTTVKTDETEVDYWMNRCGVKSVQATFINHAHADHVIDGPYVVKKFGGKLFGSSSVVNIGLGHGLSAEQVQQVKQGDSWQVGDFTIQPFLTNHVPHFMGIMLMDGHIKTPLISPASAWDYLVGDTFNYLIKHPKGTVLFQAIAKIEEKDPLEGVKVDALLLTIAKRDSTEDLIEKRILPTQAKTIIPLHYDNFFFKMNREVDVDQFWGVNVDEFAKKMRTNVDAKTLWPKYCEGVVLF